jgi:hypothetical protein
VTENERCKDERSDSAAVSAALLGIAMTLVRVPRAPHSTLQHWSRCHELLGRGWGEFRSTVICQWSGRRSSGRPPLSFISMAATGVCGRTKSDCGGGRHGTERGAAAATGGTFSCLRTLGHEEVGSVYCADESLDALDASLQKRLEA